MYLEIFLIIVTQKVLAQVKVKMLQSLYKELKHLILIIREGFEPSAPTLSKLCGELIGVNLIKLS